MTCSSIPDATPAPVAGVIAEDFAGMKSQAFGLARRAGLDPVLCPVRVRPGWRHLPASWWPMPLRAIRPLQVPSACMGASGLMISIGGTGGAVGAALRARGGRVVQIQNPRMDLRKFDLVIANRHDEISGPNVLLSRTALHGVSPACLAQARQVWAPRLAHLPRPLVSVLVGGGNGRFRLGAAEARTLATQLGRMIDRDGVGMAVTPSRRTSAEVREILSRHLTPKGAWVWDMEGDNPYLGLLACADAIVVTADSVSMISEAVATEAPVMVAALPGRSRRIGLFMQDLSQAGRIRMFGGRMCDWRVAPLDDTQGIAQEMRHRLNLK
ncbi:mitochondrial fission ELM1 family protein [Gluconacetobacter entanii]|uniref:Mitochondrial fission ELM1 family protein n=1 Tax=Gluconacetobacter entanii TaxID=108528 RepID=A0ABT3K944_9PROT|nr:mitochondrial fission ELM1 family protein [Gluconacetobacter entanii]MCW4591621.1 mitochondrial fission ELM1 family protein [Gluconacetobacter entanii]MCW4595335.1 mitochondrial fission ELM1 family protein [Gluconacetobacter entanii]NPC87785.1 hypothetical protein [Gluconacetobacter entanii]